MDDQFTVTCPYCGEEIEVSIEPDATGRLIQDCEVCCNPWQIRIVGRGDERSIQIIRADGSE